MRLTGIEADRLRNLKAVDLTLPDGLVVICGRNGQGKTSLLEAIYLLAGGRSFRTRHVQELVSWDGGPLRVAGHLSSRHGENDLAVVVDDGARRLVLDGAERELDAYLGRLDVVDLTAERMDVLRGGPDERRRFLDRGIVGRRPAYLRALGEHRRTLENRNALLRSGAAERQPDELDAWDERLTAAAARLHRERRRYAVELGLALGPIVERILPPGSELHLRYRPSPEAAGRADPRRFEEVFEEALARGRKRDREMGHTCTGPHRDELLVELGGVDLRRFGSAGQVRAAMIALKLGKLSLLREERGEVPLFLMDDFDSDLDEERAAALAAYLKEGGFQALVATSKDALVEGLEVESTKLRMDDGRARPA